LEITIKGGLRARAQIGLIKNLGVIAKKVSTLTVNTSHEGIDIGMFTAGPLPYKASETYRTIKTEFECRRSKVLAETRLQTSLL
jgi:hypothetical protein